MKLKTYISNVAAYLRDPFAIECGTSKGHLLNVAYGYRACAPELAVAIERATSGAVTRQELRPNDFWKIWPDLEHLEPVEAKVA